MAFRPYSEFPTEALGDAVKLLGTIKDLLNKVVIEARIINKYNEIGFDEIIDEDSVHEDRRR